MLNPEAVCRPDRPPVLDRPRGGQRILRRGRPRCRGLRRGWRRRFCRMPALERSGEPAGQAGVHRDCPDGSRRGHFIYVHHLGRGNRARADRPAGWRFVSVVGGRAGSLFPIRCRPGWAQSATCFRPCSGFVRFISRATNSFMTPTRRERRSWRCWACGRATLRR